LQTQIARLEGSRAPETGVTVSTGCAGLDRALPDRGFRCGTLVEWLLAGEGSGGETLAWIVAREAYREGGVLVVLDETQEFYPPAVARLGIDPARLVVIRASHAADNLWALDQVLRCPAVAAALARLERLDGRTFRRLQLAVEQGGGLGLLLRPETARHEPSWAAVRLLVTPLAGQKAEGGLPPVLRPPSPATRRLLIEVLHSQAGVREGSVEVEIDEETGTLHLVPPVADPAAGNFWIAAC
jgi:hypothetical protein